MNTKIVTSMIHCAQPVLGTALGPLLSRMQEDRAVFSKRSDLALGLGIFTSATSYLEFSCAKYCNRGFLYINPSVLTKNLLGEIKQIVSKEA